MKHKSAIEQMYYGERGHCDSIPLKKEYYKLIDIADKIEEEFIEKLNGDNELVKLYNNTLDAFTNAKCEESDSYYIEGFRFGVLLGLDIAKEKDE